MILQYISESKQTEMINLVKAQYLPGKITQKYIQIIYGTNHTDCLKALSSFHTTKKGRRLHSEEKISQFLPIRRCPTCRRQRILDILRIKTPCKSFKEMKNYTANSLTDTSEQQTCCLERNKILLSSYIFCKQQRQQIISF